MKFIQIIPHSSAAAAGFRKGIAGAAKAMTQEFARRH